LKSLKICLIVEGTYPYIIGGVSRWVHDLISELHEFRFVILHLRYGGIPTTMPYTLPENVDEIVHIPMEEFHDATLYSDWWSEIMELPEADIYHALATGFAGLLGMLIKRAANRPFLLTEHGIYWREVDDGAEELECGFKISGPDNRLFGITAERHHWRKSLRDIAAETYACADRITTVANANLKHQLELGACRERCSVIPNGISMPNNMTVTADNELHFAFVGRVTPIKDVETCILAMALARETYPEALFSIIGPLHHDQEYADKMIKLAEKLGFTRTLFSGECDPEPIYEKLTALIISSISEALPYVALEAMSFGIPVIATDVGDCSDLVAGGPGDDAGDAGIITPTSNSVAIAQAIKNIASDAALRTKMGKIGRDRVKKFYRKDICMDAYRKIYTELVPASNH
jgi:glycosyltransferase involved in cell wall biosynthesis